MRYFRNVIKWLPLIGVVTGVMVVGMYVGVIRTYQPVYDASTSLLVSRAPGNRDTYEAYVMLQEVDIARKIVNDIPELVFSTRVLQEVNRALQQELGVVSGFNVTTFRKSVATETVPNARVVHITVRYTSAEGARVVADTIAQTTAQVVQDLTGQPFIQVIKTAEKPYRIAGFGKNQLWVLGVLGGMIMGMAVVLMITLAEKEPITRGR